MGTSILKAAEISLFCLERGQMDEKQMFPLGEECSFPLANSSKREAD